MKSKIYFIILFIFLHNIINAKETLKDILKEHLIELNYTTIRYSKVYPWLKELGEEYQQYGIILNSNTVLSQCDELIHSVSINAIYKNKKYKLQLELIDTEVNLCILKSNQSFLNFKKNWKELPLGEDPKLKQNIKVFYFDDYNQLRYYKYSVNEYTITSDYGFTKLPVFTVSSSKSIKIGSPAVLNEEVVGFHSYYNDKKLIFVPASRIRYFINQYFSENYKGFVVQGLELKPVFDELKKHYNLPEDEQGCFVEEIIIGSSGYGILKEGDIILEIDGIKPNKKCFYKDPLMGYQKFELLISRNINGTYRNKGEKLKVQILRDKQVKKLEIDLKSLYNYNRSVERIPWKVYGMQPYILQHGILFIELSRSYLIERLGKNWRRQALELAYLYDNKKYYKNEKEQDKIVIISEVLPDPINIGYQDILLKPVLKANNIDIQNLKHLYQIIDKTIHSHNKILELELSNHRKIYIDLNKEKEHLNILKKFYIPSDHYLP
ncbi:MAG: hypothetical protein KatS3mg129_2244 [Leptospiraceae bacterium]|nr:MAG: hypothetical protein KatS3mg129_2244 [Leptospiraceae bacterium]